MSDGEKSADARHWRDKIIHLFLIDLNGISEAVDQTGGRPRRLEDDFLLKVRSKRGRKRGGRFEGRRVVRAGRVFRRADPEIWPEDKLV